MATSDPLQLQLWLEPEAQELWLTLTADVPLSPAPADMHPGSIRLEVHADNLLSLVCRLPHWPDAGRQQQMQQQFAEPTREELFAVMQAKNQSWSSL
jgi:hypothetical protein